MSGLLSGLVLMTSTITGAQEWDMGPLSMHVASMAVEYDSLRSLRLHGQMTANRAATPRLFSMPAHPARLETRFQRQPAISDRVRRRFVNAMARTDKADAAKLDRMIASGALFRNYDTMMGRFGFSANDVLDALASYWTVEWLLANDVAADPNPAAIAAVRRQLADRMDPVSVAALRDPAQRQEAGETLVYQFMLLDALRSRVLKGGDRALRRQAADTAFRTGVNGLGVDLRALRLTSVGFQAGQ